MIRCHELEDFIDRRPHPGRRLIVGVQGTGCVKAESRRDSGKKCDLPCDFRVLNHYWFVLVSAIVFSCYRYPALLRAIARSASAARTTVAPESMLAGRIP